MRKKICVFYYQCSRVRSLRKKFSVTGVGGNAVMVVELCENI